MHYPFKCRSKRFFEENKMMKIRKRTILAIGVVSVAVALIAMVAYPAYAAGADYRYALNQENWVLAEESANNPDAALSSSLMVQIDAKGYAFARIDQETLKQYNSTTSIVIQVQPATETTERKIDVTGSVKVNDATYSITGGKVFIGKERKLIFVNCTGTDESGNQITLKFGARYFWWGGKAYALRSKAVLQTADQPMLLLQRGIARINP
jgi:hypothetical protein